MIREVIGKVSEDASYREVVKIGQFVRTRSQRNSLGYDVPVCKGCTTPTGQEDSLLVATWLKKKQSDQCAQLQ